MSNLTYLPTSDSTSIPSLFTSFQPSKEPSCKPSLSPSIITSKPSYFPSFKVATQIPKTLAPSSFLNFWFILLFLLLGLCVICIACIFCRYAVARYRNLNDRNFREWMMDHNENDYIDDIWDATDDDDFNRPMFYRLPPAATNSSTPSRPISSRENDVTNSQSRILE